MQGRTRRQDWAAEGERGLPLDIGNSDAHLVVTLTGGISCTRHDIPAERGKRGLYYCPECKREG